MLLSFTGCSRVGMLTYVGGRHGCVVMAGRIGSLSWYFQEFQGLRCFSTLVRDIVVGLSVLDGRLCNGRKTRECGVGKATIGSYG
jgi:hypothetical protein